MKGISDELQFILKDFEVLYTQLVSKLDRPQATDNPFSSKLISRFSNKVYTLTQSSQSQKTGNQNKEILLQIYRSHLNNYINNHILGALIKCHDDSFFIQAMVKNWACFKRFIMTYHTVLIHGNEYYEKESVNTKSKEPTKELTILPVPALSLNLFSKLVIFRYQNRIERIITQLLQKQRERQNPQDQNLQIMLNMLWSCSLRDLGRITLRKDGSIFFWKQKQKKVTKEFREQEDNEKYFLEKHLKLMTSHGAVYYSSLYWNKLSHLHAKEQVQYLDMICRREQQLSVFQMPSSTSALYYLTQIRKTLLADLEGILSKTKGFKSIFMDSIEHFQEIFPLAMLYFSVFKYVHQSNITLICKIMGESLIQKGNEINAKMNKPRQHITLMLKFKKAVRQIFDSTDSHCLEIEQTMEKIFKKLLQSLECTKNLAEYTDFTIKQCLKMKLDYESCQTRFRDILFLLMSVSAKDSFLLHYQEYLAKRLIDSLNEPRTDIEAIMIKLLGEQLGNLTISHHLGMIKDIQKSAQASERLHSNIPFFSYKWDLRVFNPSVWPESTSRQRFIHLEPPNSIKTHTNLIQDLYLQHFGANLKMKFQKGTSLFEGRFPTAKVKFQAQNIYLMLLLHMCQRKSGIVNILQLRKIFTDKKTDFKAAPIYHIVHVLIENRLLLRIKSEDNLQQDEQIRLNYEYTPPQGYKPQIPILIKPSQALIKLFKQNNVDESKIIKQRQKLIDAMLVKLLKHANSTKGNTITFTELYEGIKGNSFLANLDISQTLVKQRLQYLIVKQFCKRNQDDRRIYHYIA